MFEQEHAHVLVVDDEPAIRLTLDLILRRVGYNVTTAATGEEALACLMQRTFNLLLLDPGLPGTDGVAVARYAQEYHPAAQILFLTGSSDFNDTLITEHMGELGCILKTASPQAVVDRVASVLLTLS